MVMGDRENHSLGGRVTALSGAVEGKGTKWVGCRNRSIERTI